MRKQWTVRRQAVMRRRLVWFLWLVVGGVVASPAVAVAEHMVGQGDFEFYLDSAAFRGRGGRVIAEISVRIPNSEIEFEQRDDGYHAHVRLSVLLTDLDGHHVIEDAKEMRFLEPTEARVNTSLYFQTVIKRYSIKPGVYLMSYAIEDLEAPKLTFVDVVHGNNRVSSVRNVRLELPEFPPDTPSFSQAKFLWSIDRVEGRREYHPNPPRVYGLYEDSLLVYMELYLPDSLVSAPSFEFQSVIINAKGEEMKVSRVAVPNPRREATQEGSLEAYPVLIHEDLTRFPAGRYTLYVSFSLDGHLLRRVRAGNFSVAWDIRTWEVPRRELMAEARFLLGDDEFKAFQKKTTGEQEHELDAMWKRLDPTPETDENETYDKFLSRLAYVNSHFSDTGPGVFDPRGQVYMRLGPPDDVVQDVIPLNRETVSEAIEKVQNPYHPMSFSTHGVKQYNRQTASNVVDPRELSGERAGDNVAYPFELWIYTSGGDPLLPRDRIQEMDVGIRYLFIDREGYGQYKLESSSSISTK